MANAKEILERINSVSVMKQVTQTMKLISVAKFSKAKKELENIKEYENILRNAVISNFFIEYEIKNKNKNLIIAVGANQGFCGVFNNNVCKKLFSFFNDNDKNDFDIIVIGKKVGMSIKKNGYNYDNRFESLLEHYTFENILKFSAYISDSLIYGNYDKIIFIYNEFKASTNNQVNIEEIKKFSLKNNGQYLIFDQNEEFTKSILIKKMLQTKIIKILLESNTGENCTRMISMNKATDNADILIKDLRILYNQTRQAAITNEIIEITNGAMFIK